MRNMNERPICHRAEDMVTYLYGEAGEADSKDFADHMRLCDACRSEFAVFQQVHDSILQWRNDALGAVSLAQTPATSPLAASTFISQPPSLSAFAAVREFFRVSPLWLRGATAFASLVFCVLVVFAVSRYWTGPTPTVANNPNVEITSTSEFQAAVNQEVERRLAEIKQPETQPATNATTANGGPSRRIRRNNASGSQLANLPQTRLTRKERQQLAADLRLTSSSEEDDLPFVLPNEPNW